MKKTIIVLFILFSVPVFAFFIFNKFHDSQDHDIHTVSNTSAQYDDFSYDYIYPKPITNRREVIWTFIANDFSSVSSRRSGIVKDIFVDVWDKIRAWQTLALLFDVWVKWEASANINEQNTRIQAFQIDLENAKKLQEERINEINKKINEQYILLGEAKKNKDVQVKQITDFKQNTSFIESETVSLRRQNIEIEKRNLQVLENNLQDAIIVRDAKLLDIKNKQKQTISTSLLIIHESFDTILNFLFLWNDRSIPNIRFNHNDISIYLSARNWAVRNEFLTRVQLFLTREKNSSNIWYVFNELLEIHDIAIKAVDNTVVSSEISQSLLDNFKNNIFLSNRALIDAQSNYENIITSYEVIKKTENERIHTIKNNIEKQNEIINSKKRELELALSNQNTTNTSLQNELEIIYTDTNSAIKAIKANLDVLKQSLNTVKAQEQKNIDTIKNTINIARSELNTTYSLYWNNKIISPFDGIISQRYIHVWNSIWESSIVFDMVWVASSLSNKAKREVRFSIPLELRDYIDVWSEIIFHLTDNTTHTYTWSIWRISPQIDPLTHTIWVQAKVDDDIPLPHESRVRVFIDVSNNYLRVPFSSIYERDDKHVVYFLRESGNLWFRYINIINNTGEFVDIEWENIDEGYKVITTPLFFD